MSEDKDEVLEVLSERKSDLENNLAELVKMRVSVATQINLIESKIINTGIAIARHTNTKYVEEGKVIPLTKP